MLLMQSTHEFNIWHVMNDNLMGVFRTLREEGLLPLAEIDEEGNMKEYSDDVERHCPRQFDPEGGEADGFYIPDHCDRGFMLMNGNNNATKCDREKDTWCQPGLVAVNRHGGPILLQAKTTNYPQMKWSHIFTAITDDIR